jgi:hypothetical protein
MAIIGKPRRGEIDEFTIKFLIGWIAFTLPWIELAVTGYTGHSLESISASYTFDPWPRNIFVGCLFAMAAFLLAYNGDSEPQMWLAKTASLAAFCLAAFPCACIDSTNKKFEIVPHVHLIATIVMFGVLIAFCVIFFRRAHAKLKKDPSHRQARMRRDIYVLCGAGMGVSTLLLLFAAACNLQDSPVAAYCPSDYSVVLWGETIGLVSFGIAWLTASKVFRPLARSDEINDVFVKGNRKAVLGPPGAGSYGAGL